MVSIRHRNSSFQKAEQSSTNPNGTHIAEFVSASDHLESSFDKSAYHGKMVKDHSWYVVDPHHHSPHGAANVGN